MFQSFSRQYLIYKSAKNIPQIAIIPVDDLNAGQICRYQKVLFTKDALLSILNQEKVNSN